MKFKKTLKVAPAILIIAFILPAMALAAVPQAINYQGYLTDSQGNPVADGNYNITFALYQSAAGGVTLWSETQTVFISDGIYNVQLGSVVSFPSDLFDGSLYLGVKVGTDSEMTPRQPVTSVAFALKSQDADMLEGNAADDFAPAIHQHSGADITTGTVDEARIDPDIARDSEIAWANLLGIPPEIADGDQVGITTETDPTITDPSIKDGVSWNELSAIPGGFADGIDNVGLTSESDPQVGSNTTNYVPRWSGSQLVSGPIYNSGNWVGIGTTSPDTLLEVAGNDVAQKGQLKITDTGGDDPFISFYAGSTYKSYIAYSNGVAQWGTGDGSNLAIQGGNVGIGTLSPETKLHVNGDAKFNVGGGSISVTTPGGWPGMIAYSPNGHRRDVQFYNDFMSITTSIDSSPSSSTNGIRIYENGNVSAKVLQITGGSDLSEEFDIRAGDKELLLSPGIVVSIDPQKSGDLQVSTEAYDKKVAGIISGANGVKPGLLMGQTGTRADGAYPVALSGRVYCWADASNGAIGPGDLLTTSTVPGHAMRVTDYAKAQGATIGKAMSKLDSGKGMVLVLVTLQ